MARIEFRLTDEEKELIADNAESASLSVSDYIRHRALKKPIRNRESDKIVREIIVLYQSVQDSTIGSDALMQRLEQLIVVVTER